MILHNLETVFGCCVTVTMDHGSLSMITVRKVCVLTFSVRHPAASGVPRQGFQYPHCRPLGPGGTGHPSTSYTGSRTGLVCNRKKSHILEFSYFPDFFWLGVKSPQSKA